ncbi:hypothetical protein C8R44DRAFT_973386 [Mycena epipterygia]|nr:hypothetical protein C8R44DRAFT_973386 [Mycena epipterygia]
MFSASTLLCLTLITASVPVLSAPIPAAQDLCDDLFGLNRTTCIDHEIPVILPPTSDPNDLPVQPLSDIPFPPPSSSIARAEPRPSSSIYIPVSSPSSSIDIPIPPPSQTPCVTGPACIPFEHLPVIILSPIPGGIATRGLVSIIEGLVGPGIEDIIGGLFGGGALGTVATSTDTSAASDTSPISARQLAGIAESLIPKVVTGVASAAGSVVGSGIESILGKLFNRRALADLSDDEVNQLLEYINGMDKRELEARLTLPPSVASGIGKALGENLTSAALGGLKKLFGFGSDSATTTAAPAPSA